jgi:hypothetical protein
VLGAEGWDGAPAPHKQQSTLSIKPLLQREECKYQWWTQCEPNRAVVGKGRGGVRAGARTAIDDKKSATTLPWQPEPVRPACRARSVVSSALTAVSQAAATPARGNSKGVVAHHPALEEARTQGGAAAHGKNAGASARRWPAHAVRDGLRMWRLRLGKTCTREAGCTGDMPRLALAWRGPGICAGGRPARAGRAALGRVEHCAARGCAMLHAANSPAHAHLRVKNMPLASTRFNLRSPATAQACLAPAGVMFAGKRHSRRRAAARARSSPANALMRAHRGRCARQEPFQSIQPILLAILRPPVC